MKSNDHLTNPSMFPSKASTSFNRLSKDAEKKKVIDRRKSSQMNILVNARDANGARRENSNTSKMQ